MRTPTPKIYLYKRIVQAKLFIDLHYGEAIDLENIANEAFFSKFHFIRLFKSIYGKTPHQYLTGVRIRNAKQLLQNGLSVSETCYRVGFESAGSFTALFQQQTKQSPSAFQQQYRQRQQKIATTPLAFIPACFAQQNSWI